MRAIWKGSISFGLVNIPIALYPATRREDLKFRLLRASDLSPVNYKRVAEKDGKLLLRRRPADEIELHPAYADDFRAGGELGTLRFLRDAKGTVTGFAFFAGRVLDVRFKRASQR